MRIAAKSELQRPEPATTTGNGASVATVPFSMAVLKAGLVGLKEVASHIQVKVLPSARFLKDMEKARVLAAAACL